MNYNLLKGTIGAVALAVAFSACNNEEDPGTSKNAHFTEKHHYFTTESFNANEVQTAMIEMEDGDTLHFAEGTYEFTTSLSIQDKKNITLMGDGSTKTVLSFSGQSAGAQGILATHTDGILFKDFTIQDSPGDNIKVKDSNGVTFLNMEAVYTGEASEDNGAYAVYPVACKNVLLDGVYVRGASDAGIYVGQTENVIVKNCIAEENVAGIEIENCMYADVFSNTAKNNTGGILVFSLPGLEVIKNGMHTRVFNNTIENNNHNNFAPAGNIVGNVPAGTGIMTLAYQGVEIFGNTIKNNNMTSVAIFSWAALEALDPSRLYEGDDYFKLNMDINIHNNQIITEDGQFPNLTQSAIGELVLGINLYKVFPEFNKSISHILFDGIPLYVGEQDLTNLTINNNGDGVIFTNMNVIQAPNQEDYADDQAFLEAWQMSFDVSPFAIEGGYVGSEVTVSARAE
ncbi:parallel beta-helix domain-containing protein [Limibacter armeniacum]|uniref:parallel beta-helix domain-containing protein n=1 Tax=Limibacter armeniacum TaxID=466084 RepID=UPI002FE570D6